nr:TRAP transporter small permease subunit [Enterovibrio nigricans]
MRYVFNTGSVFMQESILYFHNYVIMLGAGYALLKGAHVRVDIFYRPASDKKKGLGRFIRFPFFTRADLYLYFLYCMGLCGRFLVHYGRLSRSRRCRCPIPF